MWYGAVIRGDHADVSIGSVSERSRTALSSRPRFLTEESATRLCYRRRLLQLVLVLA